MTDQDMARELAKQFGTRMCDENGDTHGEELYCVGVDDIVDIIKQIAATEREACAKIADEAGPYTAADLIRARGRS